MTRAAPVVESLSHGGYFAQIAREKQRLREGRWPHSWLEWIQNRERLTFDVALIFPYWKRIGQGVANEVDRSKVIITVPQRLVGTIWAKI